MYFYYADPDLSVSVLSSRGHILDIPPYNNLTLTCTATSSVLSTPVNLAKTFSWTAVNMNMFQLHNFGSGRLEKSTSVLTVSGLTAGLYRYTCNVQLDLEFEAVQSNAEVVVETRGKSFDVHVP